MDSEAQNEGLRARVRAAYSLAVEKPGGKHPFPVGREFALSVGYPACVLDALPVPAVDAFCGTSNLSLTAAIHTGSTVLDLGCGAGMDCFIAASRTGAAGRVIGVDFSRSMLARAEASHSPGMHLIFLQASAELLPLRRASMDIALVNGIFNLNPMRGAIFGELARVVRPGGYAFATEIIRREPAGADEVITDDNWFA